MLLGALPVLRDVNPVVFALPLGSWGNQKGSAQ